MVATPGVPRKTQRRTIADVASLAGVSITAVSFAFNDRPGLSDATRDRIRQAAEELGWYPSSPARSLASKRTHSVGLLIRRVPELLGTDPFYMQFIAGIEQALSRRHYALILQILPEHLSESEHYRRLVDEHRVAGVFLTDLRVNDPRPQLLEELELPVVAVGAQSTGNAPQIATDDASGITAAVDHLAALGHTRIGLVGGATGYVHSHTRYGAWSAALRRHGLSTDLFEPADFTGVNGARAAGKLLDHVNPPTAIVFANDVMAIAGMQRAAVRGLSIPDDLSIVGYDDVPLAAFTNPPLTTVRIDTFRWGQTAADALLDAIDGVPQRFGDLAPPELQVRGTTASRRFR